MSPPEIGFLALGLALGITAGALLLAVVRPRFLFRPVVTVTVTPHAMAPRPTPGAATRRFRPDGFAPGSPDEDAHLGLPVSATAPVNPASPVAAEEPPDPRTHVSSAPATMPERTVAIPIVSGTAARSGTVTASAPAARGPVPSGATGPGAASGPAVAVADRPAPRTEARVATSRPEPDRRADAHAGVALPTRVDVGRSQPDLAVRSRPPMPAPRPSLAPSVVAIPIVAGRAPTRRSWDGADPGGTSTAPDACATERTQAATACAEADLARDTARSVADRLQRSFGRKGHPARA